MAWLRDGQYYYRSRRRGATVVSEYIGAGHIAELCAEIDECERLRRQAEREAFKLLADEQDALDAEIDALGAALGDLVTAMLLVNGYHQNDRRWRKQRDR